MWSPRCQEIVPRGVYSVLRGNQGQGLEAVSSVEQSQDCRSEESAKGERTEEKNHGALEQDL